MILTTTVTAVLQIFYANINGTIFQYPNEYFTLFHFILNLIGIQYGVLGLEFSYNAPTWFVSVLFIDYMIFYMSIYRFRNSKEMLPYIYIIIALLGIVLLINGTSGALFNSQVGRGVSSFFVGCFLGSIFKMRTKYNKKRLGSVALVCCILTTLAVVIYGYTTLYNLTLYMIIVSAPCLLLCALFVPWVERICSLKPFIFLGSISLEIFMWHFPIQILWEIINTSFNLNFDFSTRKIWLMYAMSVIIVSVCYKLYLKEKVTGIFGSWLKPTKPV